MKALTQSYTRTKAHRLQGVQADDGAAHQLVEQHDLRRRGRQHRVLPRNFIPKRDTKFDWTKPVDGSDPATEWNGLLSVDESPHLLNPASGWLYNVNNWPWTAAGPSSPKKADYPAYVENRRRESARGVHAIRVLENKKDFTLESLIAAAYDSYLPAFDDDDSGAAQGVRRRAGGDPLKAKVAEQIALLRAWDYRWARDVGADVARRVLGRGDRRASVTRGAAASRTSTSRRRDAEQLLQALAAASDKLTADFGKWKTPWGDINRFQRLTGDIVQPFNDAGPSIPVGFTSSTLGLARVVRRARLPGTKKWYGTSGNSFVAVVEFGDSVRAKAVTRRRRERRSEVAALQRSGGALRDRRSARRVLLSVAAQGTHRAGVPPGDR